MTALLLVVAGDEKSETWWVSTVERRQQLEGAGAVQIDLEILALTEKKLNEK